MEVLHCKFSISISFSATSVLSSITLAYKIIMLSLLFASCNWEINFSFSSSWSSSWCLDSFDSTITRWFWSREFKLSISSLSSWTSVSIAKSEMNSRLPSFCFSVKFLTHIQFAHPFSFCFLFVLPSSFDSKGWFWKLTALLVFIVSWFSFILRIEFGPFSY